MPKVRFESLSLRQVLLPLSKPQRQVGSSEWRLENSLGRLKQVLGKKALTRYALFRFGPEEQPRKEQELFCEETKPKTK